MQDLSFGTEPFSGLPKDWPEGKATVCRVAKRAGISFLLEAGNILFKAHGELDSNALHDEDAMLGFFDDKGWNKTLMCVKMQVSKKTIDHKNAYYETLTDEEKQELEENNWRTHFQDANSVLLDGLRKYMGVTKTTKASNARGNNNAQIRAILHTDEILRIINDDWGESGFDDGTPIYDYPWENPAVKVWCKLLDLFEGKGKTGTNSYYSTMRATVGSVNPSRNNAADFVHAKAELESIFATLKTQYAGDVDGLCDRLLSEQLIEMYELLTRKEEEEDAWRHALNVCIEKQQKAKLDLKATKEAADVALSMIANGNGTSKSKREPRRNGDGRRNTGKRAKPEGKSEEDLVLLTKIVQDSVAKVLQTQAGAGKGKAGATPRKPAGRGGKTDKACKHCGKVHKAPESECWDNPENSNDDKKRAARVLKLAMQMGEEENADANEGSVDDDVNESDLYVSLLPHSHALPPTCTILSAVHLQIAQALPDTQAGITVTNDRTHVTKMHNQTRTLRGIVGNASVVAHLADLAIPLQTEQGSLYHLLVRRNPRCPGGLYSPDASSIVLAHEDLEAAGMRVDYDAGRISLPNNDTINMHKNGRTWRIELASPEAQVNISKHQHPHVALQDAIWMGLSPSSLLKVYEHYNGAGFGDATKADVRNFENPVAQLYRGKATYVKSPRTKAQALQKSSIPRVRFLPRPALTAFFDPADPPSALQHSASSSPGKPFCRENKNEGKDNGKAQAAAPPVTATSARASDGQKSHNETSSQGEPPAAILRPTSGSGEHTAAVPTAPILRRSDQSHNACVTYSDRFQRAAGINNRQYLKGQVWHMDWGVAGHNTVGIKGEKYALVVVEDDSDLLEVKSTTTRSSPWEHLDQLAAKWGRYPDIIRCDNALEFVKDKKFRAWCRAHHIILDPVEGYRHRMQARVENAVNEVKTRSRIGLANACLPAKFWPATVQMVAALHNIFPRAGSTSFDMGQPHNMHCDPNFLLHPPGCLVIVKLPKEHRLVTDSSNGPRGLEGLFFGCHAVSPLVRV